VSVCTEYGIVCQHLLHINWSRCLYEGRSVIFSQFSASHSKYLLAVHGSAEEEDIVSIVSM